MTEKNFYRTRKFLNKNKESIAFIAATISAAQWKINRKPDKGLRLRKSNMYKDVLGSISIHDCNRLVTLDFGGSNTKAINDSLDKLDILLDVIKNTKKALVKAQKHLDIK